MGAVPHIGSHWKTTVEPRILEQYKGDTLTDEQKEALGCDTRWQACLKAVIDFLQEHEDACFELMSALDFKTERPTGERLDWIAGIVNVVRMPGESDEDFYYRFEVSLSIINAGTPENVIYNAALMSGDPQPVYLDEADCTFLVYTGPRPTMAGSEEIVTENNGDVVETESGDPKTTEIGAGVLYGGGEQLTRKQVKNLAPAGVLGLPSDAIATWDEDEGESLLVDENGALLLMASDDDETEVEYTAYVVDDEGNRIVTDSGDYVVVSWTE